MELDGRVTGRTQLIGLLGNPVEHSVSPQLHNTISRYLQKDLLYMAFKVEKDNLGDAVKGLKALNVLGFNVTIPYKRDIMAYLDDISEDAARIGAVNTVKNVGGKLLGSNTDADGFARSFQKQTGSDMRGKRVLLLGAGGAARAIAVKAIAEGASAVYVANRTETKAVELVEAVQRGASCELHGCSLEEIRDRDLFLSMDVIVNTTSVGTYPKVQECLLEASTVFRSDQVVVDIIANPAVTRLMELARSYGCTTQNGLGMLFYQGILAYEAWTEERLPEDVVEMAFKAFQNVLNKAD